MEDFELFWDLYNPNPEYNNRRAATSLEWQKCSEEKRAAILQWLQTNRPPDNKNPFFFVQDFRRPRQQVITAEEYYSHYHTQENRDGWVRTHIPEEQRTVYIKKVG